MLGTAGAAGAVLSGALETEGLKTLAAEKTEEALLGLGFGIDQVSLYGHRFTSDRDIFQALDLQHARTFAAFDAVAALRRVENLPWVDTAQITRLYPGGLKVEVRERQPAALWDYKGKTYLIDDTGRALGAAAANGWQLPASRVMEPTAKQRCCSQRSPVTPTLQRPWLGQIASARGAGRSCSRTARGWSLLPIARLRAWSRFQVTPFCAVRWVDPPMPSMCAPRAGLPCVR